MLNARPWLAWQKGGSATREANDDRSRYAIYDTRGCEKRVIDERCPSRNTNFLWISLAEEMRARYVAGERWNAGNLQRSQ